jgi:hypothetical protein
VNVFGTLNVIRVDNATDPSQGMALDKHGVVGDLSIKTISTLAPQNIIIISLLMLNR